MMMQVGDVMPWAPASPFYEPGTPRWHVLRCRPLREEAAALWLKDEGIKAIFPTLRRTVTVRGRKQERRTLLLPGYLFAQFPGEANWRRVLDRDNPARLILDVIRLSSGHPAVIREGDLARIRQIVAEEEGRVEREKIRETVRPGDVVRLPLVGATGEVIDITAKGGLRVRLELFGSVREVMVEGSVEKVTG